MNWTCGFQTPSPRTVLRPPRTEAGATSRPRTIRERSRSPSTLSLAELCPMRCLERDRSARVIIRGHALMQNLRRGHYGFGVDARAHRRVAHAFTELAQTI